MMRTLAADRQRLDDVQGQVEPRVQPDRPARAARALSNLCTEILEVTSQTETAVCNLGSINLGAPHDRGRRRGDVRLRQARAHRATRPSGSSIASSTSTSIRSPRPRLEHYAGAQSASASWGLQDVFFQMRARLRRSRGAVRSRADRGGSLPRALGVGGALRREGPPPGVRRTARRAASCSSTRGA